ncbi:spore coat protein CotJB [Bacillota bacterium LX-D]|nr:spore coat protein CotJB [Bacillota bacterium LX-D]
MRYDQVDALRRIQELEFTAVELTLYLDTHPQEKEPLAMFNKISQELNKAKMAYEDRYGPLLSYGFSPNNGSTWQWTESPWPWEIEY